MQKSLKIARKDPNSKKGIILKAARKMFGKYGFHGATTRIISDEAGIDVANLHYHWGEKADLYKAVIMDINEDLRQKLLALEKVVHGLPLREHMSIALDVLVSYLFEHSEIPRALLYRHFVEIRNSESNELDVPMFISNIAYSTGLSNTRQDVSPRHKMQVLAIMNLTYSFISGAESFQKALKIGKDEYLVLVKETLKFVFIPPFTDCEQGEQNGG